MPTRHFQHRLQLRVFGLPQPSAAAKLSLRSVEQGFQPAEFIQQIARQLHRRHALHPGAQEYRQQLGVRQRFSAFFNQFFAGAFGGGPVNNGHDSSLNSVVEWK